MGKRDLSSLFNPQSVCVVGASADPSRLTGKPLQRLVAHKFPGKITLVNPKYRDINSYPCYPSVRELPEAPDVVIVMLPAEMVPDLTVQCGEKGIRNMVVLSSGFEEAGGHHLAEQMKAAADRYGVNVVGPNSEGLWSIPYRAILTFGSAAARDFIHEGGVTVLSQSGSIGGGMMRILQEKKVGCRFFVSIGNETVLTTLDYLDYIVQDGGSKVVLMFLEGLKDGERLRELALEARANGIQLVALKGGASEAGRQATASHTGKIASAQKVYSDVFRQCGVIEVASLAELLQAGELFQLAKSLPSLSGKAGIGVISISGGSRALIADACERRQVPMAVFSKETEGQLRAVIPSFGVASNPADPTGQILSDPTLFDKMLDVIADDPSVEALLIQYANRGPQQVQENMEFLTQVPRRTGKPIAVSFLGEEIDGAVRKTLLENDVLSAGDPDEAVRYLSWLYRRRDNLANPVVTTSRNGRHRAGGSNLATWREQTAFLESCGISVPRWEMLGSSRDVARLDAKLAFPVVAKALPEDSQHKTEMGLVRLNIRSAEELESAVADLQRILGSGKQVLVQEMVKGGLEVLLTVRRDPDFGPVMAVGSGGILVELMGDVAYLSMPLEEAEISSAIDGLKLRRLLQGYRGQPPRDVAALVRAAKGLSEAYLAIYPKVSEIELNPLFVLEDGHGVVAVDVLVG